MSIANVAFCIECKRVFLGEAILFAHDLGGDGLLAGAAGKIEAVAAGDDLRLAVEFLPKDDRRRAKALVAAAQRLDHAGLGVAVFLELLDVLVDDDVADGELDDGMLR